MRARFPRHDVAFFDAGFTLIKPRRSVFEVYYEEAEKLSAAPSDRDLFRSQFRAAWQTINRDFRAAQPDGRTSEDFEREAWFRFTAALAGPHPALAAQHESWLRALVTWFDSPEAWVPLPGAVDLLVALKNEGWRLGVLSNWHGALHRILAPTELRPLVDVVLTSVEVGFRKPHPALFERGIAMMDTSPERALYVGDSYQDDVLGAQGCKLATVWLNPTRHPHEGPSPDLIVESLEQL